MYGVPTRSRFPAAAAFNNPMLTAHLPSKAFQAPSGMHDVLRFQSEDHCCGHRACNSSLYFDILIHDTSHCKLRGIGGLTVLSRTSGSYEVRYDMSYAGGA